MRCTTENGPESHTDDQELYKIRGGQFQRKQKSELTTLIKGENTNINSRAINNINQWNNCICMEGPSQSLIEPTRNEIKDKTADEIWNQGCPKK